jgi:hypothetical protein
MVINSFLNNIFKNFKELVKEDREAATDYFNAFTITLENYIVNAFLLKKCVVDENVPLIKNIISLTINKNLIHVFHPVLGMNALCELDNRTYYHAATVSTDDIDMFFMKCQNEFNEDYRMFNVRSTSVGDIVLVDKRYYMIKPAGIQQLKINEDFQILEITTI